MNNSKADMKVGLTNLITGVIYGNRAWLEQAASRYKAVLYSLALFRLSYPEDFLSVSIPNSPNPVARRWRL